MTSPRRTIRLGSVLVVLSACGAAPHAVSQRVQVRAAADLECPQSKVRVTRLEDPSIFDASGCGRQAMYNVESDEIRLSSGITDVPPGEAGRVLAATSSPAPIPDSCSPAKQLGGTPRPLPSFYIPPAACANRDTTRVTLPAGELEAIAKQLPRAHQRAGGVVIVEVANEHDFAIAYGCRSHDSRVNVVSGVDFARDHLWVVLWEHSTDDTYRPAFRIDRDSRTTLGFSTEVAGCHGDAPGIVTEVVGFLLPADRHESDVFFCPATPTGPVCSGDSPPP